MKSGLLIEAPMWDAWRGRGEERSGSISRKLLSIVHTFNYKNVLNTPKNLVLTQNI